MGVDMATVKPVQHMQEGARTGEDAEGGGLAGAVYAEQAEALALPDGRAQARDRRHRQLPMRTRVRLHDAVQQHLAVLRLHTYINFALPSTFGLHQWGIRP